MHARFACIAQTGEHFACIADSRLTLALLLRYILAMDDARRSQLQRLIDDMEQASEAFFERIVTSGLTHALPQYGLHVALLRLFRIVCSSRLSRGQDFTAAEEWRLGRLHALDLRTQLERIYGPDVVARLAAAGQQKQETQ